MTRILQANLRRSTTAQNLLDQSAREKQTDLVLISEQHHNRNQTGWYPDLTGTCAVWIRNSNHFQVRGYGQGNGFVWVRCSGTTFFSVYLTPNERIDTFARKLEVLEDAVSGTVGPVLVGGDLNAKAVEWGMPQTDARGRRILEMAARVGMNVLNIGNTPTCRREMCKGTIPDVTLASESLFPRIHNWRVLEDYTASDHQYIALEIRDSLTRHPPTQPHSSGWNTGKMDVERFVDVLMTRTQAVGTPPGGRGLTAEEVVNSTMSIITAACGSSMPRRRPRHCKAAVYWWTTEIAAKRRECHKLRRESQRARSQEEACTKKEAYRSARRVLRGLINDSKAQRWQELVHDVDMDPWGLGYKLVMQKLGARRTPCLLAAQKMDEIVQALFPSHPVREDAVQLEVPVVCPLFTGEELEEAVLSMKTKKAPGPDGVPVEVMQLVYRSCPDLLLSTFNACLHEGTFPKCWKVARLVLISKGKGDPESPSAYRPLCMLDTAGKVLEKLIKGRLTDAVRVAGDLSPRQYGFRSGRSTIDAVSEVMAAVHRAEAYGRTRRRVVLLVTLDVRNAFNSARWTDILGALEDDFGVPDYLMRLLRSYLRERSLIFDTKEGQRSADVTSGVAQGSILGPDLWNVFYDGLLRLEMPPESRLIGYADDVAALVSGLTVEHAQLRLGVLMRRVLGWMDARGLSIAPEKTGVVILTKRRIPRIRTISVGDALIESKPCVKYLGVLLDSRMSFSEHVREAANRAATRVSALSRLMANLGGPSPTRRRLLMSTTQSVLLYGAEIWGGVLGREVHRKKLAQVQRRGALRVASAYRTVAESVVLVIAGVIPIALLADERRRLYLRRFEEDATGVRREERQRTVDAWQRTWEAEQCGAWTRRLVGDLRPWFSRVHGEADFYLTQLLSGHGCFRSYLHKIGKARSQDCLFCPGKKDDACHTFFACGRWERQRADLHAKVGEITPESLISEMLSSYDKWSCVAHYARAILVVKKGLLESLEASRVEGALL